MNDQTALLNALASHQGSAAGIGAPELARQLGVSPRLLRRQIKAARNDGIAICGLPATGYYMPVTPQELQQCCDFLEHRALGTLRQLSRMKNQALPALLGQLLLNQA